MTPGTVLFLCVQNAGRSLMAEAIFNADPPPGWTATSAGTRPASAPHARTGPMLAERGVSLPPHPPRALTPELMAEAAVRVTMGCRDDASCPVYFGQYDVRDWALPDPAPLDDAGFRQVRDRLFALVKGLRTELVLSDRRTAELRRSASR